MRGVQNEKYGYIYNPWSNGKRTFKSETMNGLTLNAMREAAKTDPAIAERVDLFLHRVPEEFFDYEKDPDALHNLIDDPQYLDIINKFRGLMEKHLRSTNDPVLVPFLSRYDKEVVGEYLTDQDQIVKDRVARGFYARPGKELKKQK